MTNEFLTLFVDASWCPKTGAAGWGGWAIRDEWQRGRVFGGLFSGPCASINEAEIGGIAAALQQLHGAGDIADVLKFSIQSDNMHALNVIYGRAVHARAMRGPNAHFTKLVRAAKPEIDAAKAILEITGTRPVYLKHVKGHNGEADGRSWVNTQCDRVAGRNMRAARAAIGSAA